MASRMVRIRLRTGMMTEASYRSYRRELNLLELRARYPRFLSDVRYMPLHLNLAVTVLGST